MAKGIFRIFSKSNRRTNWIRHPISILHEQVSIDAKKKLERDYLISEWNPKISYSYTNVYMVVGRRQKGKTSLCLDLCSHINSSRSEPTHISYFSESDPTPEKENNILLSFYQCIRKDKDIVESIINSRLGKWSKNAHQFEDHEIVVYDNIFRDTIHFKTMANLAMNGRCFGISFIMSTSYPFSRPVVNLNVDYVFIFRDHRRDYLRSIYKFFFSHHISFHTFVDIIHDVTDVYDCLVFDNTALLGRQFLFGYNIRKKRD